MKMEINRENHEKKHENSNLSTKKHENRDFWQKKLRRAKQSKMFASGEQSSQHFLHAKYEVLIKN